MFFSASIFVGEKLFVLITRAALNYFSLPQDLLSILDFQTNGVEPSCKYIWMEICLSTNMITILWSYKTPQITIILPHHIGCCRNTISMIFVLDLVFAFIFVSALASIFVFVLRKDLLWACRVGLGGVQQLEKWICTLSHPLYTPPG